jgi:hypothetical protein
MCLRAVLAVRSISFGTQLPNPIEPLRTPIPSAGCEPILMSKVLYASLLTTKAQAPPKTQHKSIQ